MGAHVLFNLLNELGEKDSFSPNEFNKFNNYAGARMEDFNYHMTLKSYFVDKV